ncbi:MAG: restriction endonuclease subunit S [Saprospiraceae bacterium]|uniref:restriction endonuclease subunit S n=1 Tax=Candidatus Brachybacter algidus TaxID=2982024 RepID=UPI002579A090|nr:restriction endonuclease subunit S [Candidatus Brachybacter algidus]MBK7602423.1 restriction endonuclease subunit S [Candidatus Brachybacter algidus]
MKHDWEIKRLDDACEVEYGTRVVQKKDGGKIYPVYGGGGATFFMDTFNREDCLVVGRFAMSAQCTRFVEGKFFLNDSGLTVRPKNDKELLPDFLNLQILFLNDHIYSLSRGTAQRNLDVPAFRNIKIAYPKSLPKQQRIVSILDEAFAAIAKAKANAEQNLKNAKELFESYLQGVFENGNWETKKLNEITEVKDGTHDSPKYIKEGIPFITQKNIKPNGLSFDDTKFITDTDHEKFYKRSNVAYGDILISMIGANRGMAAIVDDKRVFSIKNVGLIKSSDSINMNYLLYFLKSSLAMKYVLYMSNGGAQEFVGLTALRSFPIPFPTLKEQQTIVRQLDALRAETQKLEAVYQKKLDDLEELKKSILQKAFAGELKTEKAVAV